MQNTSIYGQYNATLPTVGDGQPCRIQLDSSGRIIIGSITPGTGATSIAKAEDAVHASGDVGIMALGVRRDTAVALGADGDYIPSIYDGSGNMWVTLGTKLSGEDQSNDVLKVEEQFTYTNITTQTTTTIKSGSGYLKGFVINTPVASAVWTIYDNTAGSGSKIGTVTLPATLLSSGPITVLYQAKFTIGLTVVTSGASADSTFESR